MMPKATEMPEHDPLERVHFRLWQIAASSVTVFGTAWLWVLNPIAGIIAAFLAKHILVAILASGLGRYDSND
jgi:hypothetical protein